MTPARLHSLRFRYRLGGTAALLGLTACAVLWFLVPFPSGGWVAMPLMPLALWPLVICLPGERVGRQLIRRHAVGTDADEVQTVSDLPRYHASHHLRWPWPRTMFHARDVEREPERWSTRRKADFAVASIGLYLAIGILLVPVGLCLAFLYSSRYAPPEGTPLALLALLLLWAAVAHVVSVDRHLGREIRRLMACPSVTAGAEPRVGHGHAGTLTVSTRERVG